MTSLKAFLKISISAGVPTVTRTCVGHAGQTLPMYTFFFSMASINCRPALFTSTIQQLLWDGTKEYLFAASQEKTSFRTSALIFFRSATKLLLFKLQVPATTAVIGMESHP